VGGIVKGKKINKNKNKNKRVPGANRLLKANSLIKNPTGSHNRPFPSNNAS
jgi:hypothetical protein